MVSSYSHISPAHTSKIFLLTLHASSTSTLSVPRSHSESSSSGWLWSVSVESFQDLILAGTNSTSHQSNFSKTVAETANITEDWCSPSRGQSCCYKGVFSFGDSISQPLLHLERDYMTNFTNKVMIEPIYFTSVLLWLRRRQVFSTVSLIIHQLNEETLAGRRDQGRKGLGHGRLPMNASIRRCHEWEINVSCVKRLKWRGCSSQELDYPNSYRDSVGITWSSKNKLGIREHLKMPGTKELNK